MIHVYEELGDSSRRSILSELRSGPKSVTDLVQATGLKQPNVSNHLARMKSRSVVQSEKVGRQVFYSFASPEVAQVVHLALAVTTSSPESLDHEQKSKQFARAATMGDEFTCNEIIDSAVRHPASLFEIYERILDAAMNLVTVWHKLDAIDEAQHHVASEVTLRSMARVVQALGPIKRVNRTALLGCAENEWYMIRLRMIADILRLNGWRIVFLGAGISQTAFASAVKQHRPDLVLLSCGSENGIESTLDMIQQLSEGRNKRNRYLIGVCSSDPAHDGVRETGADFCSSSLSEFVNVHLPQIEKSNKG